MKNVLRIKQLKSINNHIIGKLNQKLIAYTREDSNMTVKEDPTVILSTGQPLN